MAVLESFRDGWTALSTTPTLLVAGGLLAALPLVSLLDVGPSVEPLVTLGLVLTVPFVLGGFLGMAVRTVQNGESSLWSFAEAAVRNYLRLLAATVLFVAVVAGLFAVLFAGSLAPMALLAGLDLGETAMVGAGVGFALSALVTLVAVPALVLSLQFFAPAIVAEERGVLSGFRRSVGLVRHNLGSVVAFTLLWALVVSLVPHPETLLTAGGVDTVRSLVAPVSSLVPVVVLAATLFSVVGLTYCYTVYTAYFLRLAGERPAWSREPESSDSGVPTGTQ